MSCPCRLLLTYLFPALLLHGECRGGGGWRLMARWSPRVGAPRAAEMPPRSLSPSRQLPVPAPAKRSRAPSSPRFLGCAPVSAGSAQSPGRLERSFWKGAKPPARDFHLLKRLPQVLGETFIHCWIFKL